MRTVKQLMQDNFKCIADRCPCTCCSGWQIVIDEDSLDRYSHAGGSTGKMLKSLIDWEEGTFLQYDNKDCACLNRSGLCDLITECGEEILCDTCRLYPRHLEEYEDLREWSLSLSCPEVARMLTSLDDFMEFSIVDDDEEDPLWEEFEDFDLILFSKLLDARELIFNLIKRNDIPFEHTIALIIELARELQESYDSGDYFTMDDIMSRYLSSDPADLITGNFSALSYVRDNACVLDNLERLSDDWDELLACLDLLPDSVDWACSDFLTNVDSERHMLIIKNMLIALLYTYFPGSIYTGMIYGVTCMCIFAVLLVDSLGRCKSLDKSQPITLSEYEEILYKYSRETEHSDLNVNALLEYFDL